MPPSKRKHPSRPQRPATGGAYHHGDLRKALLDAAREQVTAGDSAELSLRALARTVGVSPAAPYHHFPDRPALFAALATEGFAALDAALAQACAGLDDPAAILATSCATYLRFAIAHGGHYRLMFSRDYRDPERYADYHRVSQAALATLAAKVAAVDPSRSPEQVESCTLAIWAMAHGTVQLWLDGVLAPESPQAADVRLDALAEEIAAHALALVR